MNRRILTLLLALGCLAWNAASYSVNGSGTQLFRWPSGTTITYVINSQGNPNHAPELNRPSLVAAFNAWNTVMQANGINVRFVDGGNTNFNTATCDQVNLVSFTATLNLPPGVLAVAQSFTAPSAGSIGGCGSTNIQAFAGQVLDSDMIFNDKLIFATNGQIRSDNKETFDLDPVTLHEAGHMLGLHHSGIPSAIMSPAEGLGAPRTLTTDEIAGINAVYGTNGPGGSITGRITDGGGAGVLGAHVVATDATTGQTFASVFSNADGSYTIVGLVPGSYTVLAEPMDGPNFLGIPDYPDRFQNGRSDFGTAFGSGAVTVAAGQPATVNLSVGAKTMNLDGGMAVARGNLILIGPPALSVPRGGSVQEICFGGTGLSGEITFSLPSGKAVAAGATGNCSFVNNARGRSFTIAADTPIGVYDVRLPGAALPGYLRITNNPGLPANGIVDAAAAATVIAPGSIISLYGTDLAPAVSAAQSLPLPTQLAGVSVRIGDRFAPLYFVSPGQINAMVPFEVSGNVRVQIVAGNASSSAEVTKALSANSPRMFSINQQGTGQGAIQIANTVIFAAPTGSIPGVQARPARRGEFLTIYCSGLGPVSGTPVSGSASSGSTLSTTTTTPAVTVGGVPATPTFAGLAPGFVGLYQINLAIPATTASGSSVPIVITMGGVTSNTVTIAVE